MKKLLGIYMCQIKKIELDLFITANMTDTSLSTGIPNISELIIAERHPKMQDKESQA